LRRTEEQHQVAQRYRHRRPDRGFDLCRVGGQPRHHFAALGLIEEGGAKPGHMREHVAAQVGDDALAKCGHQVEPRGARQC
jgi:hypothetical protein